MYVFLNFSFLKVAINQTNEVILRSLGIQQNPINQLDLQKWPSVTHVDHYKATH